MIFLDATLLVGCVVVHCPRGKLMIPDSISKWDYRLQISANSASMPGPISYWDIYLTAHYVNLPAINMATYGFVTQTCRGFPINISLTRPNHSPIFLYAREWILGSGDRYSWWIFISKYQFCVENNWRKRRHYANSPMLGEVLTVFFDNNVKMRNRY